MKGYKTTLATAIATFAVSVCAGFSMLVTPTTTTLAEETPVTVATSSVITAVDPTKLTVADTGAVLTGEATINGVFNGTATIQYKIDTQGLRGGYAFTVCDEEDNEILAVVRSARAHYYYCTYAHYNGTYSWNTGNGVTNTTTEKWASYSELPDTNSLGNLLTFTNNGDTFKIQSSGYSAGVAEAGTYTVADFTLTEADAAALGDGFKIGVRPVNGSKEYDVKPIYNDVRDVRISAINGVSVGQTVTVDSATESISYDGAVDNVIALAYGAGLNAFTYTSQYTIGSLSSTSSEEVIYDTEDFSTKDAGTYNITVTKGNASKDYQVIVSEPLSVATSSVITAADSTNLSISDAGATISGPAAINGVFDDTAKIGYAIKNYCGYAFTVCDEEDNEILAVVRSAKANYNVSMYAYYNGTYSWNIGNGVTNTATEKWASSSDLPNGSSLGKWLTFTNTGDTFTIQTSGYSNGVADAGTYTVANFALTAEDVAALADGFKIGVRKVDGSKEYDVKPLYNNYFDITVNSINDATLGTTVTVDSATESISYDGAVDNVITLNYGSNLNAFTYATNYAIGSLTISTTEDVTYSEDFTAKTEGSYNIDVTAGSVTKSYAVIVKSPIDTCNLEMGYGAYVRVGTSNGGYGLKFTSVISKTDYEYLMSQVGEDKYYQSVSYGMVILPLDYITANGELTVGQLFGNEAIYDWAVNGEYVKAGKTRIINLTTESMRYSASDDNYVFYGSITDIKEYNLKRDFVARGYICYTLANGEVGYKLFDYNQDNIANNTRSIYTVAQSAVNSGDVTGEAKTWFEDNVLDLVEYTVEYYTVTDGTVTLADSVTLYGLNGNSAFVPAKSYSGYTLDVNYAGSVTSATLSASTETVLKIYFVAEV